MDIYKSRKNLFSSSTRTFVFVCWARAACWRVGTFGPEHLHSYPTTLGSPPRARREDGWDGRLDRSPSNGDFRAGKGRGKRPSNVVGVVETQGLRTLARPGTEESHRTTPVDGTSKRLNRAGSLRGLRNVLTCLGRGGRRVPTWTHAPPQPRNFHSRSRSRDGMEPTPLRWLWSRDPLR